MCFQKIRLLGPGVPQPSPKGSMAHAHLKQTQLSLAAEAATNKRIRRDPVVGPRVTTTTVAATLTPLLARHVGDLHLHILVAHLRAGISRMKGGVGWGVGPWGAAEGRRWAHRSGPTPGPPTAKFPTPRAHSDAALHAQDVVAVARLVDRLQAAVGQFHAQAQPIQHVAAAHALVGHAAGENHGVRPDECRSGAGGLPWPQPLWCGAGFPRFKVLPDAVGRVAMIGAGLEAPRQVLGAVAVNSGAQDELHGLRAVVWADGGQRLSGRVSRARWEGEMGVGVGGWG